MGHNHTAQIRPLTGADAVAFTELRLHGIRSFPNAFLLTETEAAGIPRERVEQALRSGGFIGAFAGLGLIGFIAQRAQGLSQTSHRSEVGPFYVHPDHQGTGAARALMTHVEQAAHSSGASQLELWVEQSNHRARALYTDAGFCKVGEMPAAVRIDDASFTDVHMIRNLATPLPARSTDGLHRLTSADWRAFRDVRLDMLSRDPAGFGSTHADWAAMAPDEIADWLRNIHLWAVVENGRILATAGWAPLTGAVVGHRGHVIAVYVRPEARGRGLARRVMAAIAEDARGLGIAQLELDVGADNPAARALYEAMGFGVTGGIPRCLNHDGVIQNQLYMVRPL